MKRWIAFFLIFILTGCASFFGSKTQKQQKQEEKQRTKVEALSDKESVLNKEKIRQIASFSSGIDYSLQKINAPEPAIQVAKDLNQRVISLAGVPDIDSQKEMWDMVDKLVSTIADQRALGLKLLKQRDARVSEVEGAEKANLDAKNAEIQKYMDLAAKTAKTADASQSQLNKYTSYFGIEAIFLGLKQLFFSALWFLVAAAILFLLLRLAKDSNPAIAVIFTLFEIPASLFMKVWGVVFPGAISLAGHIKLPVFQSYKKALTQIVDGIQFLKEKDPNAKYTVDEVCAAIKMDQPERDVVDSIKKELNWK